MEELPAGVTWEIASALGAAVLIALIPILRKYSPKTKTKLDDWLLVILTAVFPSYAAKKTGKTEKPPDE
jgi:hypothetical protein